MMQNLYMIATVLREEQMQQMVSLINANKISIGQAMEQFNVSTEAAVMNEVERINLINKRKRAVKQTAMSIFNFPKSFKWAFK